MDTIISIKNLTVNYQENRAIDAITLNIPANVRTAIIGPNGAGKSTLIKAIMNLIPNQHDKLTIFGQNSKSVLKRIAYIPQTAKVNWNFPTTVYDVILMGISSNRWLFQTISPLQYKKVNQAIQQMELEKIKHRNINQLSGGQKQRVFIARAIAQDADLYLLDEPLAGVDMHSEKLIMDQLREFQQNGKTSITVHHDLNTVTNYFDSVILLNKTLVAYGPTATTFTAENINKTFYGFKDIIHPLLQAERSK